MRNHICAFLVSLAVSGALTGQGLTSVTGVTKDTVTLDVRELHARIRLRTEGEIHAGSHD